MSEVSGRHSRNQSRCCRRWRSSSDTCGNRRACRRRSSGLTRPVPHGAGLVPCCTLATAVHMQFLGAGPMFTVTSMDFGIPRALPFYLILGVICGLAAVGFSRLLYLTEDQFEKLPVDEIWWAAIGALWLGIICYFLAP